MMPPSGLEFRTGCVCAGSGCGGHLALGVGPVSFTPTGWQGPVQHTWTAGCAGAHAPGPCPTRSAILTI